MWRLKIQTASITAISPLLCHSLVFRGLKACLPFGYSHLPIEITQMMNLSCQDFIYIKMKPSPGRPVLLWTSMASMDTKLNGRSELLCRGTLKRTFLERTRELVSKNSKLQKQCGSQGNYIHTKYIKSMSCIYLRTSVKYTINTVKEFLIITTHNIYQGNDKFMVTYCKVHFIVDFGFVTLTSSVQEYTDPKLRATK